MLDSMESFKKLSIQVGLNGLSFCVIDTITNTIVDSDSSFYEVEQTPYLILKELKSLLEKHDLIGSRFAEVVLIHRTMRFGLVPKALFDKTNLTDYIKFNASVSANEKVVYDDLGSLDLINVYIPFSEINDFVFEIFGEFRFVHNTTTLLKTFLKQNSETGNHCFVHVLDHEMEVLIMQDNKLLLYNQHQIGTKEDFLYHLLFSLEQLGITVDEVKLHLFGSAKEEDKFQAIAKDYIRDVDIINPVNATLGVSELDRTALDFTVLNSL